MKENQRLLITSCWAAKVRMLHLKRSGSEYFSFLLHFTKWKFSPLVNLFKNRPTTHQCNKAQNEILLSVAL